MLITNLTTESTFELHLLHPVTGMPLYEDEDNKLNPLVIVLHGPGTKPQKAIRNKLMDKNLKRKAKTLTAEQLLEDSTELLAGCSSHALNLTLEDGKAINTVEQFKELYSHPGLTWVREQVDAALNDTANFMKG